MTEIKASTIRPGLLVVLKTSLTGNVSYIKNTIEADTLDEEGKLRAKWETERTVADPAEHEEATKIRNRARQVISNLCVQTAFGLLCPEERADQLGERVTEAQSLAEEFNARAKTTRIGIYVIPGRVAADDAQAARAINSEVRDLIGLMEAGLQNLDVKKVRDAADKARSLGAMLSPAQQERLSEVVAVARKAATAINKAGEQGAAEIDLASIRKLTEGRGAFLDLDAEHKEVEAPTHEGRAIDLAPVEIEQPAEAAVPVVEIETVDLQADTSVPEAPVPALEF
ncbi:hypothetical protein [Bradyrhizobium sp. Tv2a-2]|uniref:hypothetical protein n=1 Tax=Bradyrhizobium sp. Tv2a-2 TaxID=113395 RepID=UPI0004040FF3|nr:hypothetical protein [Bradyrhizobium sp. Tv2a-2]